jgi:hypothetical protein
MPAVRNCEGVVLPSGVRSLHGRMVMAMLLSRCTDNARLEEARLMDWSAVWTELPKAVPPLAGAFVGGLLAVAGGVVGQYLTHRYARARDAEKLIREKAEQLIHELYADRHWFTAQHDSLFLADS